MLIMSIALQVQLKSMQKKKKVHDTNIKHKNTLTIQQTCTSPWSHINKRGVESSSVSSKKLACAQSHHNMQRTRYPKIFFLEIGRNFHFSLRKEFCSNVKVRDGTTMCHKLV
jgi:hypothetical protein